jgi:hypothetical protein
VAKAILQLLEAIGLRAAPGLINLGALLFLGGLFVPADYGIYSTIVATATFAANLAFGPLTFAVVSQHARLDVAGDGERYETSLVSAVLLAGVAISAVAGVVAMAALIPAVWIAPTVAFGIYTAVQEILHARLKLWLYGAAALVQAASFLALIWWLVRPMPSVETALIAFSASYALAAVVSLALSGLLRLRRPDFKLLGSTLSVGGGYTLSNLAEQGLNLGVRYLTLAFGTPQSLGVVSFCLDLGQRLVGFLVSIAGFTFVPRAFRDEARGEGAFFKTLVTGAIAASGFAALSIAAVLLLQASGRVPALASAVFSPWVFFILSSAIVINRVKKLVVDPMAMRARTTWPIGLGYAIGAMAMATLFLTVAGVGPQAASLHYLVGIAIATLITAATLYIVERRRTA